MNFYSVFFFKFLNTLCLDKIQKSHIFYKKFFDLGHQKEVLDECSSTLEIFFVKYLLISRSANIIFSTLAKNTIRIEKLKKANDNFFGDCPTFIFDQKLFIIFFL